MSLSENVISESAKTSPLTAPVAAPAGDREYRGTRATGSGQASVSFPDGEVFGSVFTPVKPRDSPLDLINEHLTESIPFPSVPAFVPVERSINTPTNWFCRPFDDRLGEPLRYVAKIQPFTSGGYEVTLTKLDLTRVERALDHSRSSGPRVLSDQSADSVESSIRRSKRMVRHKIKSMACDRLLTLTRRESHPSDFWSVADWQAAWDKFNRLCKRVGEPIHYVAVLERHKKGNYHLHAAIVGRVNVKLIRKFWLLCCAGGAGSGNVDVKYRLNVTKHQRLAGLAKYVSKYITKQLEHVEFNKKRYWSSCHTLPDCRRYILSADEVGAALAELADFLNLAPLAVHDSAFFFGGGLNLWFSFDEHLWAARPF